MAKEEWDDAGKRKVAAFLKPSNFEQPFCFNAFTAPQAFFEE